MNLFPQCLTRQTVVNAMNFFLTVSHGRLLSVLCPFFLVSEFRTAATDCCLLWISSRFTRPCAAHGSRLSTLGTEFFVPSTVNFINLFFHSLCLAQRTIFHTATLSFSSVYCSRACAIRRGRSNLVGVPSWPIRKANRRCRGWWKEQSVSTGHSLWL